MGEAKVLKGVYKDGDVVASVVQQDKLARIMVKGVEPETPGDGGFVSILEKVAGACSAHVKEFEERELCAVLVQKPLLAEHVEVAPDQIKGMGLTQVAAMDGTCGIVVRRCEADGAPTPLPYASLRADSRGLAEQPGVVVIPPEFPRKTHKDLTPPQKQVFEAAAQIASASLFKLVCFEDEGLRMTVTVRDLPPARARTVLVGLGGFADELAQGTPLAEIGKRLSVCRGG